jgi:hypothetical protein
MKVIFALLLLSLFVVAEASAEPFDGKGFLDQQQRWSGH